MANLKEILEWLDENAWEYVKTENAGIQKVYKGYDSESLIADMALIFREDEQAGSHPINQWHKVEDELPPRIKERVNISKAVMVSNGLSYGTGYYNYNLNKWFCVGTTNITHWMEIPELPKEE